MINKRESLLGWLLLTPAAILILTFVHWPTIATVISSVYRPATNVRAAQFLGFENYKQLASDPVFLKAAGNNLVYALGTVFPSIAFAVIMAIWVNGKIIARGALRLSFFIPTILPMVAAANIWLFFYTPEIGMLNKILNTFGIEGMNWLGDPKTALGSIIVLNIWKQSGFFMIFYLAGLQAIPKMYNEAALIEGANSWTIFRRITFPLLGPTTMFVLINALINAFKMVDHLFILTKGGPNNATNLLLYYIYDTAFSFFDNSYAGTLTLVLLVFLAIIAFINFKFLDKRVHYQ